MNESLETHELECLAVSVGDEFVWDESSAVVDLSDLECHSLLAADLPISSQNSSMQSTAHH